MTAEHSQCPKCHGKGMIEIKKANRCPKCRGMGSRKLWSHAVTFKYAMILFNGKNRIPPAAVSYKRPQIRYHSITHQIGLEFSNNQPLKAAYMRKGSSLPIGGPASHISGVQVLTAMGVCFQTRGRFQQGSGKIDWARRPGCAKVISNVITKAPNLMQGSRPLTPLLNSISEGNAFSDLKTDPYGAFTYVNYRILGGWMKIGVISARGSLLSESANSASFHYTAGCFAVQLLAAPEGVVRAKGIFAACPPYFLAGLPCT